MNKNNNNLDRELNDVLNAFRHSIKSFFLEEARKCGCSLTHFEVLRFISDKGSVTMKEIAAWLQITPPSASSLVDVLVEKKLVSRVSSKDDRRIINIVLNKEADKIFDSIHNRKMLIFKKIFSNLNSEDKKDLIRILSKCIEDKYEK